MRTRDIYEILNPEGHRVHTTKSRQEAFRLQQKFNAADGVRHTIRPCTARQERAW